MAGLVPAIHALLCGGSARKTWMPGTRPGMTEPNLNAYACHRSSALAAESTPAMTATARGRGEMVDATDLSQNLSAPAETRDAELLKVGETCQMAIPSQALWPKAKAKV